MLGVLCNRSSIAECISILRGLIGPALRQKEEAAVFFTLPQPGLQDGFVQGIVTTGTLVREGRVPIPEVVLNFARVRRRSDAKELRALNGQPATYVVNPTNRLNQLMAMEMLQSSETTCGLVAPYETVCRENAPGYLQGRDSCVVIPESGTNLNLVVQAGRDGQAMERAFDRMPSRLIILELPEFSTNGNRLVVLRAHLQRSGDGQWRLLEHARTPKKPNAQVVPGSLVGEAALSIAGLVGKFIPRLGICFVDLTFDPDGSPFFLHLGGWDSRFFGSADALAKASQDMPVDFWDWDLMGDRRQMYYGFSSNLLGYVALLGRGVA